MIMKTKLQALIEEQKALTAKFKELVNETNYAFIGDKDRAEDIKTFLNSTLDCERRDCIYFHNIKTNLPDVYLMGSLAVTHKHFEDYTIVDLKCEPDFFKKHSNSEIPNNLDPKKVYIKGHPTRGAEAIKMLEDLGGVNDANLKGQHNYEVYYITPKGHISIIQLNDAMADYTELHLPEEVSEVDPPKEEIELIEGEVYDIGNYIGIFKNRITNNLTRWYCVLTLNQTFEAHEVSYGQCLNAKIATPEQRKQLFDALEKAGKYFDKENMRLIDVEEWSCEQGLPFIARHHNKDKWKCVIFWEFYNKKGSKGRPIALFKSNEYCDYKCAIPYNDQTKHLIGKTDSPDKHYKFVRNDK